MKRLSAICLLTLAPAITLANIIPTGRTPQGLGPFTWVYDFQLSSDQDARPGASPGANPVPVVTSGLGAFVTIYDFAGYVGGTCTGPSGWNCTAQNAGYTPDRVEPLDELDVVNLTWTYVSGAVIRGGVGGVGGVDLGAFSAVSIYDLVGEVNYAARAIKNNGNSAGSYADNVGSTQGPVAPGLVTEVPEPSSLALAGLAIGLVAWSRKGSASKDSKARSRA